MSILEKHYTPVQLAQMWGLSVDTIRSMFRDEPDVLVIDRPEKVHKRGYKSIRIPESVAVRVHQKHQSRRRSG